MRTLGFSLNICPRWSTISVGRDRSRLVHVHARSLPVSQRRISWVANNGREKPFFLFLPLKTTRRRRKTKSTAAERTTFVAFRPGFAGRRVGDDRSRREIGDGGFLFELAQRENAQRGDARRAEDEDNVHRRVRFAERNSGDEIEKEDEKHDRRKRRRSDAKEFGHDAVPKGLASSVGLQGRRRDARPRADEISPDRAANDAPRSGAPRTRDASFF